MEAKEISDDAGFSLSEVLIGFAIASVSLVVILGSVTSALASASLAREAMSAHKLALEKLTLVGQEIPIAEGLTAGHEPQDWTVRVTPFDGLPSPLADSMRFAPYQVVVEVRYGDARIPERTLQLSSIMIGTRPVDQ